jgi:hypothetical protein
VEATVIGAFYVLRIIYSKSLHPDYSFLAYFTRSQLTSTVVLLVIFTPKARYFICSEATHWHDFSTRFFFDEIHTVFWSKHHRQETTVQIYACIH